MAKWRKVRGGNEAGATTRWFAATIVAMESGNVVAVVDDEENIRETIGWALEREGFRTLKFRDGQEAWEALERELPDLAILDILMPRMDGLDLCRRLRGVSPELPIIFLTSKDDEIDRVVGLELGADDYLGKPFSMRELIARIRVLFRRVALSKAPDDSEDERLEIGDLILDLRRYEVRWKADPVQLTVTEFMLLHALAKHPGFVKTREQLTREAYRFDNYVSERTIDSHIKRLRRKMEQADPGFDRIVTVYGVGYKYREGQ